MEQAITAIDTIDNLTEEGRTEEADIIRGVLNNRSVSSAEELASVIET